MRECSVAINYHLNLNHRALQPDQRKLFLEQTLPELIRTIEVPTTISSSAEDLLIVQKASPEAWEGIVENPDIKIAPSLYSHMLAELFPETFVEQAEASMKIAQAVLPKDKLSPFGYPPELSVPPPTTNADIERIWQGTVYCDTRATNNSGTKLPPNFVDETGLAYAVSIRELRYREALHMYLRETGSPEDVMSALLEDTEQLANGTPLVARIDLETPVFNSVCVGDNVGVPRTDLFANMQRQYARSPNIRFIFLGEEILEHAQLTTLSAPVASEHAVDKWRNDTLQNELRALAGRKSNMNAPQHWSTLASDYFVHPTEDFIHRATYHGQPGIIRIRCDGEARFDELNRKVAALTLGIPLADVLTKDDDLYLHYVHRASVRAADILRQ